MSFSRTVLRPAIDECDIAAPSLVGRLDQPVYKFSALVGVENLWRTEVGQDALLKHGRDFVFRRSLQRKENVEFREVVVKVSNVRIVAVHAVAHVDQVNLDSVQEVTLDDRFEVRSSVRRRSCELTDGAVLAELLNEAPSGSEIVSLCLHVKPTNQPLHL